MLSELPVEKLRSLYQELRAVVNPIQTREILLAAASLKTSRLGMDDCQVNWLQGVLTKYEIALFKSKKRLLGYRDIGKGGWSNKFAQELPETEDSGEWLVYIARSQRTAEAARDAEAENREEDFGSVLGIPRCCTEFYLSHQEIAQKKQNDYVPLVLNNTRGQFPFDYWNNYVAQYFGYSLLSFFPCSFNCKQAARVSRMTYEFLQRINKRFANAFVYMQQQSILYTEYRGIFLFEGSQYRNQCLYYKPAKIHTTLRNAALLRYLSAGVHLKINSTHNVDIYFKDTVIKSCRGDNVSVCIF